MEKRQSFRLAFKAKLAIAVMLVWFAAMTTTAAQAPDSVRNDGTELSDTSLAGQSAPSATAYQQDGVADIVPEESQSFHQVLKTKFIEGDASFMSLVALALVLGLAFCIERVIYLSLSEINAKRFMADLGTKIASGDIDAALQQCRDTRGPVASICCEGLERIDDSIDNIERSVAAYGTVQAANLEKGCSWITLFIAMAPSLGFLGTVIGMVMAFEQIQLAGDINPTIVAAGM